MRHLLTSVTMLAVVLAGLSVGWVAPARVQDPAPEEVEWQTDLAAAQATAAESERPLLIVFR